MKYLIAFGLVVTLLLSAVPVSAVSSPGCAEKAAFCFSKSAYETTNLINQVKTPELAVPLWYGTSQGGDNE